MYKRLQKLRNLDQNTKEWLRFFEKMLLLHEINDEYSIILSNGFKEKKSKK